jgi:predicted phage-related endonuclease
MEFGHKMEPVIADWFNEEFGMELVNDTHLYAHPEHPFMLANLDRRIGEEAVIEIKTSRREWNEVPPYYVAQIQHYMAVTNLPIAYCVALFNGEFPPRVFKVPRDDQYIARLIDAETDFWQMVVKHAAPVVDGHEATHSALRSAYEPEQNKTVELGDELTKLIVERASAKANIERYEEVVRQCEARIMELMGDAETATVNGTKMVTWKQQNRTSVDSKALSQKYPQLAEEFEKRSTFRVLKITTPKE